MLYQRSRRLTKALLLTACVGLLASIATPSAATAADRDEDLLALLQQLTAAAPSQAQQVLTDRASSSTQRAVVPTSAQRPVSIDSASAPVSVSVVGAGSSQSIGEGLTSYSVAGADVVPIAKVDGVQFVSISDEGDPLEFSYQFDMPESAGLHQIVEGGVVIGAAVNTPDAIVGAPWAVDATGKSVPTEYFVDGNTLTQKIHPTSDTTYPIIADPYVGGLWLTGYQWENSACILVEPSNVFRVSCVPGAIPCWNTSSGWLWGELLPAQNATNRAKLQTSEYNQLLCHAVAVPFKSTYNLDTNIPDKGLAGFIASGCN